ncbi:hypothetical protein DES39_0707 [Orbus hercynius]|uniref:Uncharacterized protein n=2 Tax=Orbus hercynius TaxID=593135 RepID=A0A495RIW1_9GAMM|nr:YeeE/YedE thiosulfate transporter family protein [Orbus hercynius]RKS87473.1 hypothetical protein DES39_0707 [Orbus hercynius]
MELTLTDIVLGILGGTLIGLACALLWVTLGKITGISGILSRLLSFHYRENSWRFAFFAGMLAGGVFFSWLMPPPQLVNTLTGDNRLMAILGGLLVGFGAVYGSGCTSGHGVCGLSRLSKLSFVAVSLFMIFGIITVTLLHLIITGAQ